MQPQIVQGGLGVRPFRNANELSGNPAELRKRADSDGYLFFERLLDEEPVRALGELVLQQCQSRNWLEPGFPYQHGIARAGIQLGAYDNPRWIDLMTDVLCHPTFANLRSQPAIQGVLSVLFGGEPQPEVGDICRVVSSGSARWTTAPHQDRHYIKGNSLLWTVWIPLSDCPIELGGLCVLPASHRRGLRPHLGAGVTQTAQLEEADPVWATGDMRCGDAIFFHGLTVHRALDNVSKNRLRLSADYRFRAAGPGPGA